MSIYKQKWRDGWCCGVLRVEHLEWLMRKLEKAVVVAFYPIIITFFQLLYLIAFSCELSHLLDTRRTSTDLVSILLCVIYFILFFSATVLINGLATRMATGLLVWSFLVSLLSIPELWLIMVQFWVNMPKYSIFSSTLNFLFPPGHWVESRVEWSHHLFCPVNN